MAGLPLPILAGIFLVAAAMVVLAAMVLARTADEIADRTGLGALFVGMLLLAGATSLPEVVTDVSAALAGAPDLAVADLFGSSMANMAILAFIDLVHRGQVWPHVGVRQARLAAVAIALTAGALLGLLAGPGITLGWVGIDSVLLALGYVAAVRWLRTASAIPHLPVPSATADGAGPPPDRAGWRSLRATILWFAGASLTVLLFAPILALSAQQIAAVTGFGETFLGTLLLAASTSLPELVASLTAVRIGAYELAVGNLFGSNAYNMTALLAADLAYLPGPILAAAQPEHAIAGLAAIVMMGVALAAVLNEAPRHRRLEPTALLVIVIWIIALGTLFASGRVA